jgi:hypothetical protein
VQRVQNTDEGGEPKQDDTGRSPGRTRTARSEIASRLCSATAARMWMVSLFACGLSTATNSTPESIRVATRRDFETTDRLG